MMMKAFRVCCRRGGEHSSNQHAHTYTQSQQFSPSPSPPLLASKLNVKHLPPFVPPITEGCVVKVYDGDTITIAARVPGLHASPIYKFSVRLNGIDTPEMRTHNEEEKTVAVKAQKALSDRIFGKTVTLKNVSLEKYGRLLADVHFEGCHLNQWLIDQRLALPYDGGTKAIPMSWVRFLESGTMK
jgi:micrococcal nuclease